MGKHNEQIVTVTVDNGRLSDEARAAILFIVRAEHTNAQITEQPWDGDPNILTEFDTTENRERFARVWGAAQKDEPLPDLVQTALGKLQEMLEDLIKHGTIQSYSIDASPQILRDPGTRMSVPIPDFCERHAAEMGKQTEAVKEIFGRSVEWGPANEFVELVAAERTRQIEVEGYDAEHDLSPQHVRGQLAQAACYYAWPSSQKVTLYPADWDPKFAKRTTKTRRQQLVVAAALLNAEWDRLNRLRDVMEDEKPDEPPSWRALAATWEETAQQNQINTDYYRGLLTVVATNFGPEVLTADDGTVMDEPLLAKVPELVRDLAAKTQWLRARNDDLRESLAEMAIRAEMAEKASAAELDEDADCLLCEYINVAPSDPPCRGCVAMAYCAANHFVPKAAPVEAAVVPTPEPGADPADLLEYALDVIENRDLYRDVKEQVAWIRERMATAGALSESEGGRE